jgi:Protein of unknown function (DUF3015)
MKKLLAFVAVLALPASLFAKGNHPMSGCGLGYALFGHSDNSKMMQVFAATTNGTSGNQTFGITSGTSGCTEDGAVKFVKEAEVFAEVNLDSLRREMAAGQGEYVRTFASLLGASETNVSQLVQLFHDQYASLFPTSATSTAELLSNLQTALSSRQDLLS